MQMESYNAEMHTLATLRPWVMIDTIETDSGSLSLNLGLRILGQSPPANIEFAVVPLELCRITLTTM
jgi:hypothetical protein